MKSIQIIFRLDSTLRFSERQDNNLDIFFLDRQIIENFSGVFDILNRCPVHELFNKNISVFGLRKEENTSDILIHFNVTVDKLPAYTFTVFKLLLLTDDTGTKFKKYILTQSDDQKDQDETLNTLEQAISLAVQKYDFLDILDIPIPDEKPKVLNSIRVTAAYQSEQRKIGLKNFSHSNKNAELQESQGTISRYKRRTTQSQIIRGGVIRYSTTKKSKVNKLVARYNRPVKYGRHFKKSFVPSLGEKRTRIILKKYTEDEILSSGIRFPRKE